MEDEIIHVNKNQYLYLQIEEYFYVIIFII
jgi:hypothetical protein